MANRHHPERRRVEANRSGLHESHDQDWTQRDTDRDEAGDQHHHHHHHHHGDQSQQSDRDYERLAEQAHSRTQGGQHGGNDRGRQHGGNDRGRQHGGNDQGHQHGGEQHGQSTGQGGHHHPGRETEREYGSRREQRGRSGTEQGNPHTGSQRGSHREQGISGRMTGQRGSSTHHSDPSDSTFREGTGGQREHRHGGGRGTSERDRKYGSRRGHGSERRTDQRRSSK